MRKLALTLAFFALFGAAHARVFIGFPGSTIFVADTTVGMAGVHFGSYDAFGYIGGRVTFEASVLSDPSFGQFLEGGVDVLFSSGESTVLYAGAGGGYAAFGPLGDPFVSGFVGVDFDAASTISLFLELNPRYIFDGSSLIHVRSGINFQFGGPSTTTRPNAAASEPEDEDSVWLEPYDPDADPNG